MKKGLKIFLISFSVFIGILLISFGVVMLTVFTPERLTKIVRSQTTKYINCKTEIGEVELTFLSTFPDVGIEINGLTLINPMNGACNDTLLHAGKGIASLDIKALWKNDDLIIHKLIFEDVLVNAFTDKSGISNYDVFITDTTDTSSFVNPFKKIDLREIRLKKANISYEDETSDMHAVVSNLYAGLKFQLQNEKVVFLLNAKTPSVSYSMDSIQYCSNADVKLNLPMEYLTAKRQLNLNDAKLEFNGLDANIDGTIKQNGENIITDIAFNTASFPVKTLIEMIPAVYTTALDGMNVNGFVSSTGTVKGIYNENSMPLIDVLATMDKGTFEYSSLPYKLHDITGGADVKIDLNNEAESKIILKKVVAKTGQSELEASGLINYILMDDMLFNLDVKINFHLPELEPMMPDDMNIGFEGFARGSGHFRFMLSDAMNMDIQKMNISGKFDAVDLGITYDSLIMRAPTAKLDIAIPNKNSSKTGFMDAGLWCDRLSVNKGKNMSASIRNANMKAQTSNLIQTDQLNTINCDFNFDDMTGSMDGMLALLDKSKGKLAVEMNFSDSVTVPKVSCDFDVVKLKAVVDDSTSAVINYPKGSFKMYAAQHNTAISVFDIKGITGFIQAVRGTQIMTGKYLDINTNITYDDTKNNLMEQWQPKGDMWLREGTITADGLKAPVKIPVLRMDFTPDVFNIHESKFLVDNSDFSLNGKLWNIADYMNDKGLLKGDFYFDSKTTDVYQLMALTNGFGVEDSTSAPTVQTDQKTSTSSGPYMVPKGMDVKLHVDVNKVLLGYDSAQNVLGNVYVKNGLLVLEDVRLSTSAARMQLTSIYKTPRKNHLYLGVDFHMMDMEISELLKMIPDIDTIMPMLRSFSGKGEFHIAVETYLDSMYNLKTSTLRGVSSIKGENLVLMDGETFSEIAKTLNFNKKAENKVDSLSAEFTIFRNEVDIYPFLIVMDKYKAVVAGRHNLDMSFDYHISVTDSPLPVKLGVNVKGTMDELMNSPMKCIRPVPCKYANLYRPASRNEIGKKQLEIRQKIRESLLTGVINP